MSLRLRAVARKVLPQVRVVDGKQFAVLNGAVVEQRGRFRLPQQDPERAGCPRGDR